MNYKILFFQLLAPYTFLQVIWKELEVSSLRKYTLTHTLKTEQEPWAKKGIMKWEIEKE